MVMVSIWQQGAPAGADTPAHAPSPRLTHWVCLVLSAVQLMAVVEDVLIGGVEAGLHTVLHHLAGSWGALQLLDLDEQGGSSTSGSLSPAAPPGANTTPTLQRIGANKSQAPHWRDGASEAPAIPSSERR